MHHGIGGIIAGFNIAGIARSQHQQYRDTKSPYRTYFHYDTFLSRYWFPHAGVTAALGEQPFGGVTGT
jgi:hypothetical protein